MSLGVLDSPLRWREVPQDEIGDVQQRSATFTVPTPHGDVEFFVHGTRLRIHGRGPEALNLDFGKDLGWTDARLRGIRRRWTNYRQRNPRRRSVEAYLTRARRPGDLAYYARFMAAREALPAKSFTIIATITDIAQQWLTEDGHRYVAYTPSDDTRARLYYTMVRMLAPKARIFNEPEDPTSTHIWDLRP